MATSPPKACPKCGKAKCDCKALRESAAKRGYDLAWKKCRLNYLKENPLCLDCLSGTNNHGRPKTTLAEQVHHIQRVIDRPDLRLDFDNLMALCSQCHSKRTAKGE